MTNDIFEQIRPYITDQSIYVALSAVIAVFIYIEGEMLKKAKGKLPQSKFFHFSSVLDTVWFFVSMAVVYFMDFDSLVLVVPTVYGIYTVAGWVYGSRLIRQNGMPESVKDITIPAKYIAFTQSFAVMFFLLCIFSLIYPLVISHRVSIVT